MHRLTKDQKKENLELQIQRTKKKKERLELNIKQMEAKLSKYNNQEPAGQSKSVFSGSNPIESLRSEL